MITPPKGMRDFYPKEKLKRKIINEKIRKVLDANGFFEYEASLVEKFELFESKSSAELVNEQSYVFEDKGGRKLVLRPELTPSLARMISSKQQELPRIIKWYSMPLCFRYERPQAGRYRAFYQLNVDSVGSSSAYADYEIIKTAVEILTEIGFKKGQFKIFVNHRELIKEKLFSLGVADNCMTGVLNILDSFKKKTKDELIKLLSESAGNEDVAIIIYDEFQSPENFRGMKAFDRVNKLLEMFEDANLGDCVEFNPLIIRGLDYYTGIVFEAFATESGINRSILGGGRYDNLLESVGGQSSSGAGYGMGIDTVIDIMEALNIEVPGSEQDDMVGIIPLSEKEFGFAEKIGENLRYRGFKVFMGDPTLPAKTNLKVASKLPIRKVCIVGEAEKSEGGVTVKDMLSGDQKTVKLEEILSELES